MKKFCIMLAIVLLLSCVWGCQQETTEPAGIAFYYCVTDLTFGAQDSVITAEYRQNIPQDNWAQVLDLYLQGPTSDTLRSPFPAGLKTLKTTMENTTMYVTFSEKLASLSGLELTLACSCICMTCMALSGAETVVISAEDALLDGQKSITMDANTLLLLDIMPEGE